MPVRQNSLPKKKQDTYLEYVNSGCPKESVS